MKKAIPFYAIFLFVSICANSYRLYAGPSGTNEEIRSNLYVRPASGAPVLLDGDLTQYDPSFTNALDGMDARKMTNFSENIGMIRSIYILVIERRHTIQVTDTIFYKTWNMQQRAYQLEFLTTNLDHPGLEGYLEDSYLQTSTPIGLNGRSTIDFDVTSDPSSASVTRFRVIFKTVAGSALPLTFRYLNGYHDNHNIYINWKTENENNLGTYTIQKSRNGVTFNSLHDVKAKNMALNDYQYTDDQPYNGNSYYRIAIHSTDGKTSYSQIKQLSTEAGAAQLSIYPNPVQGHDIPLYFSNMPEGTYTILLLNSSGQMLFVQHVRHNGGTSTYTVHPNQLMKAGVYHLQVTGEDGLSQTLPFLY